MFEAISNPPKNKGKEKDVGKRRAYVRVVTSLGGASLNLELFCEKVSMVGAFAGLCLTLQLQAPKTCYNFLMLAKQGKYNDVIFHRLVPGFMVSACLYCARQERLPPPKIQTGDPTGTGSGGESFWGTPFRDEYDLKGAAKHDERGVISMANKGKDSNGLVQILLSYTCV
jgi:peptidyl-prolyl cis-trans isomerase-like protein 2